MLNTGSALANTRAAASGESIVVIGPVQTREIARASPTAKNGASPVFRQELHALAMISGPIPAGSPIETASGATIAGSLL